MELKAMEMKSSISNTARCSPGQLPLKDKPRGPDSDAIKQPHGVA